MNNLLLPDVLAMAMLLGVLALVRRRYPQHDIRLWMGALLLILLESGAHLVYGMHLPGFWHGAAHVIALDSYALAGTLFLRSALPELPQAPWFAGLNTAPVLLLMTEYGAGAKSPVLFAATALGGMVIAVLSSTLLRRPRLYPISLLIMWLPATAATLLASPRLATYLLLAALYVMIAVLLFWSLPRISSGRLVVVAGFAIWGGCFATHTWVSTVHPNWKAFAGEVWNMQKFLITTGFLLVLFEREVDSNEWLALHDQLTGLPNRRLFQDRMSNAMARAERNGTALILFCLDLNDFKEVNDTLGHDVGDSLLRSVSASLQRVVRRTDTLARLGGDEFLLLATDVKGARAEAEDRGSRVPDSQATTHGRNTLLQDAAGRAQTTHDSVLRHAARIESDLREALHQPFALPDRPEVKPILVTVSIGIAVFPTDGTDLVQLSRVADQRMYEDKRRQHAQRGRVDRVLSMLGANTA